MALPAIAGFLAEDVGALVVSAPDALAGCG